MSKQKNTRQKRKNRYNESCLAAYRASLGSGRRKRYARMLAKQGKA